MQLSIRDSGDDKLIPLGYRNGMINAAATYSFWYFGYPRTEAEVRTRLI